MTRPNTRVQRTRSSASRHRAPLTRHPLGAASVRTVLIIAVIVGGLASGPSALRSAALSEPPLAWRDLAVAFAGSVLGIVLVLGFQGLRRNSKGLTLGFSLLGVAAISCLAAGVSALVVSAIRGPVVAHSFLFLVVGVGLVLGLVILKRLFARQLKGGA